MDRRALLILHHIAGEQVASVRSRVEQHVLRPPGETAVEHGLERLVGGIVVVEGQIIAEQQRVCLQPGQMGEQPPDRGDILARQLDQQQRPVEATVFDDLGVDGLDQAGLAHAARTPEQGVVRRTALGKAQGVFQQCAARALDPEQ